MLRVFSTPEVKHSLDGKTSEERVGWSLELCAVIHENLRQYVEEKIYKEIEVIIIRTKRTVCSV